MNIEQFMRGYKAAWEARDDSMFAALFTVDGVYHNTPFAAQVGHAQLREYWNRVKLQDNVQLIYEVLATSNQGGIAHWHVTYQVASEELCQIWAKAAGSNLGCAETRRSVATDGSGRCPSGGVQGWSVLHLPTLVALAGAISLTRRERDA